ncbi:MAG: hypothetical protein HY205_04140 [Nitrospirae bacterium]|nr:hypothetical protein [Nitrospirota bacterium]
MLYDERGIQIGIQHDPSTGEGSPPALNSHPAQLTVDEVRQLLGLIRVSGYSGTLAGLLVKPQPIPLFKEDELSLIAAPLAAAFRQVGRRERVFFSLPNMQAPYEPDRTAGALFFRGLYLHMVLTDHAVFTRTDTGGGDDDRDLRDTKGLKLFVVPPAKAAVFPPEQGPHWGAFEKVVLSVNVQEALVSSVTPSLPQIAQPKPTPVQPQPQNVPNQAEDLRLQLRELANSNQALQNRLKEQADAMEALKAEFSRMKQELEKSKKKAPRQKPPTP